MKSYHFSFKNEAMSSVILTLFGLVVGAIPLVVVYVVRAH